MRFFIVLGLWVALIVGAGSVGDETNAPLMVLYLTGAFFYMLPANIGLIRKHRYRWIIFILNIFGGWTGLGWILLFAWSVWPKNTSLNPPKERSLMAKMPADEATF